jgi:hypothetical protein
MGEHRMKLEGLEERRPEEMEERMPEEMEPNSLVELGHHKELRGYSGTPFEPWQGLRSRRGSRRTSC